MSQRDLLLDNLSLYDDEVVDWVLSNKKISPK
jgi:hypothetical protein